MTLTLGTLSFEPIFSKKKFILNYITNLLIKVDDSYVFITLNIIY